MYVYMEKWKPSNVFTTCLVKHSKTVIITLDPGQQLLFILF